MHKLLILVLTLFSLQALGQSKTSYLKDNRFDLNSTEFKFPQEDFKIIGFGAYHGSAKTYEAEMKLIRSLKQQGIMEYYVPETNFSQAFFFQQYLETGDEALLKELVMGFQTIVSQEGTIETFEHWKKLRALNQKYASNPIKIIGFDVIAEFKFPIKHILYLSESIQNWEQRAALQAKLADKEANFSTRSEENQKLLKSFINDYEANKNLYISKIKDTVIFHHILKNIQYVLDRQKSREEIIFDNYVELKDRYQLGGKKQFFKYGFFHIEKQREEDSPSFFTRLIEANVYDRDKVITVMGYLTKSEVLWEKVYDEQGNYKTYTIEKGYGIGDYWKEYFKGIKRLKKTQLSDLTLYRLNQQNSPYNEGSDLLEVKLLLKRSNGKALKGKGTTDFIDYAVLISDSRPQIPLEEM
ncbi:hypothetical protein C9994_12615 [Marivirga lumbricoides]|uniref:TraB/GumN family protein n=1 Tax=Marivirga lumbricoides TaxID=1046115 RepID=A0A2T4DJ86_9BACT|nr:hypothetical protein C9994_12615 [Marivirga lumbricoides]